MLQPPGKWSPVRGEQCWASSLRHCRKSWCSYTCRLIWNNDMDAAEVPQPIAGPGGARTETRTAQDRDRPSGGRNELSYGAPTATSTPHQRGGAAVLIMATPNRM